MNKTCDIDKPLLLLARLPHEKETKSRIERLKDQRQAIAKLLKKLSEDPLLAYDGTGKPILENDPERSLSISHSPHYALVGVAPYGYCIGVDVEEQDQKALRLASRYCSAQERTLLHRHDLPVVALWSAKEAVYKVVSGEISGFAKDILLEQVKGSKLTMKVRTKADKERRVHVHLIQALAPTITYAIYPEIDEPAVVAWEDHSESLSPGSHPRQGKE